MGKDSQSTFQFSNPAMIEVHFVIHKDFNAEVMGDELEMPIQVMFPPPSTIETQSNSVAAQLTVEVGKDDSTFPFFLSVTMGADFRWEETLPEEMVKQMLSRNAPMLLLAYARPLVAQITGSSPAGPIHIPFLNFLQQDDR